MFFDPPAPPPAVAAARPQLLQWQPPTPTAGLLAPVDPPDKRQALVDSLTTLLGPNAFAVREGPDVLKQRLAAMSPADRAQWQASHQRRGFAPIGQTLLSSVEAQPDTIELYGGSRDPLRTPLHESGHVADHRNVMPPQVVNALLDAMPRFEPLTPQDQHYRDTESEYVAEGWARAFDLLRKKQGTPSEKDVARADRDYPGLRSLIEWMQQQPLFSPPAGR